jgi:hypothetical protein
MKQVIAKTFGGLTKQYYIRQFIFGLIFPAIFIFSFSQSSQQVTIPLSSIGLFIVSSLLYPYSRFVYESVVNFIMGGNVFWVNAIMLIIVKFITMALCWSFAIFIAPIGLVYLYFHHSKQEQSPSE